MDFFFSFPLRGLFQTVLHNHFASKRIQNQLKSAHIQIIRSEKLRLRTHQIIRTKAHIHSKLQTIGKWIKTECRVRIGAHTVSCVIYKSREHNAKWSMPIHNNDLTKWMAINLSNKLRKSSSQNTAKCENRNWKSDFLCARTLTICGSVEYLFFLSVLFTIPIMTIQTWRWITKENAPNKASSGSGSKNKNEWKKSAHTLPYQQCGQFRQSTQIIVFLLYSSSGWLLCARLKFNFQVRQKKMQALLWNWNW